MMRYAAYVYYIVFQPYGLTSLSQNSWNDAAVHSVKEQGLESNFFVKYPASKVLSERAALDFVK